MKPKRGRNISTKTRTDRGRAESDEPERAPGGKVPPWAKESHGAGGEGSFGAWLRRQREIREIDLGEIADRTKISLRYLKAMEQDRFDVLPAKVFAKGFLREYAKYVGLNPDEVVNFYLAAHHEGPPEVDPEDESGAHRRPRARSPWAMGLAVTLGGLLLLALVAYLAFWAESRREERPSPVPLPPVSTPAPPVPAPRPAAAPVAPEAPLEVTLDFTQDCWIEVLIDGSERISELHVQGESLQLAADESVLLVNIGNPAGVEVQVNGRPFDLPGAPDRPARDVLIDLETYGRPPPADPGPTAP